MASVGKVDKEKGWRFCQKLENVPCGTRRRPGGLCRCEQVFEKPLRKGVKKPGEENPTGLGK